MATGRAVSNHELFSPREEPVLPARPRTEPTRYHFLFCGSRVALRFDSVFEDYEFRCLECGRVILLQTKGRHQKHTLSADGAGAITLDRPVSCRCGISITVRDGEGGYTRPSPTQG